MEKPILIWSCYCGTANSSAEDPNHCISLWEQRKALLNNNGLELKLLVPKRELRRPGIFPVIDHFEKTHPEMILDCPGIRKVGYERNYDQRLEWPRDNFLKLDDIVYTPESCFFHTSSLMMNLDLNLELLASDMGEGGHSVRFDHSLVVADDEIPMEDTGFIERRGYIIHKMPVLRHEREGLDNYAERLLSRMSVNGHLDTEMNILLTPTGKKVLVVNVDYYRTFKQETDDIARKIDSELHVIEDVGEIMRKAVNFLQLPTGDVILSRDHEKLAGYIASQIGNERVHQIETFRYECSESDGGGGLRCRTNIILP